MGCLHPAWCGKCNLCKGLLNKGLGHISSLITLISPVDALKKFCYLSSILSPAVTLHSLDAAASVLNLISHPAWSVLSLFFIIIPQLLLVSLLIISFSLVYTAGALVWTITPQLHHHLSAVCCVPLVILLVALLELMTHDTSLLTPAAPYTRADQERWAPDCLLSLFIHIILTQLVVIICSSFSGHYQLSACCIALNWPCLFQQCGALSLRLDAHAPI